MCKSKISRKREEQVFTSSICLRFLFFEKLRKNLPSLPAKSSSSLTLLLLTLSLCHTRRLESGVDNGGGCERGSVSVLRGRWAAPQRAEERSGALRTKRTSVQVRRVKHGFRVVVPDRPRLLCSRFFPRTLLPYTVAHLFASRTPSASSRHVANRRPTPPPRHGLQPHSCVFYFLTFFTFFENAQNSNSHAFFFPSPLFLSQRWDASGPGRLDVAAARHAGPRGRDAAPRTSLSGHVPRSPRYLSGPISL